MSSLTDLVKGIRLNKGRESEFISGALSHIKAELGTTDVAVKANALRKLSYVSCRFIILNGVELRGD